MAAILHVSLRTLDKFVAEGMPSENWGLRSRVFKPSEALAWARDRGERMAA
jgi:phage terminase Nu1 subunit (DNA packaging protein)